MRTPGADWVIVCISHLTWGTRSVPDRLPYHGRARRRGGAQGRMYCRASVRERAKRRGQPLHSSAHARSKTRPQQDPGGLVCISSYIAGTRCPECFREPVESPAASGSTHQRDIVEPDALWS